MNDMKEFLYSGANVLATYEEQDSSYRFCQLQDNFYVDHFDEKIIYATRAADNRAAIIHPKNVLTIDGMSLDRLIEARDAIKPRRRKNRKRKVQEVN